MKLTREQRIEKVAEALYRACGPGQWAVQSDGTKGWWSKLAAYVVDEQDRREGPLVGYARYRASYGDATAKKRVDEHDALDAAPEPTLLEAVDRAEASRFVDDAEPDVHIRKREWDAVKAAADRERRKA